GVYPRDGTGGVLTKLQVALASMKQVVLERSEPDVESFAGEPREKRVVIANVGHVSHALMPGEARQLRSPDRQLDVRESLEQAPQRLHEHLAEVIVLPTRRVDQPRRAI